MSLYTEKEGIPTGSTSRSSSRARWSPNSSGSSAAGDDEVQIFLDETQAAFRFGSIRLVTALIEGNFPNYEMVVPRKHDKEARIQTLPFTEAVRRTRTMTNEKFNSVRFQLNEDSMTLRVVTPEVGEYREDMSIDYKGGAIEVAFNPDFILDVLRRIDTEQVSFVLKDASSPGLLKPTDDGTSVYLNVVMPIRI
jgi:DNA polymerase-3 subunit beta